MDTIIFFIAVGIAGTLVTLWVLSWDKKKQHES